MLETRIAITVTIYHHLPSDYQGIPILFNSGWER